MSVRSRMARGNLCCNVVMPVPVIAKIVYTVEPPIPFHCLYRNNCSHEYPHDYPHDYPHEYPHDYQNNYLQQFSENDINILPTEDDKDYHLPPSYPIVEYSENATLLSGNIVINTTDSVPEGYLSCDGSNVSRSTYSDLFKAVGTYYGAGDKKDTFSLPNLQDDNNLSHYLIKI